MYYTVTCNPAIDYVVHTGTLQIGTVNRTLSEEIHIGGKGINVSCILHELGIPSKALGFIAGFTGEAIAQGLAERGISEDFIRLPQGFSRINLKIHADGETELNGQGPQIPADALSALFAKLDQLTAGDTLILAGSIPSSLPDDVYEQMLRRIEGKGIRAVVDATGALLRRVLPYKPFLIKPNHHELGELFGTTLTRTEEIAEYARKLQVLGAQNVLVSRAGDGALLLDENGQVHTCGVCKGTVKHAVGAGDSMLAGFLAGLENGDFSHALRLGTAAGGATAFSDGLAKGEEILHLMEEF